MTTLCLAGNCLFCETTFLLGSAKADAQNATESVIAVHRANQPNLFSVLMSPFCSFFPFAARETDGQRSDEIGWSSSLEVTAPAQLDSNRIDSAFQPSKSGDAFGLKLVRDSFFRDCRTRMRGLS